MKERGNAMSGKKLIKPYPDIPTKRVEMPEAAPAQRVTSFAEVELGFPEDLARAEARRCLSCRGCLGCGLCAVVCKPRAIDYGQCDEDIEIDADGIIITPGTVKLSPALDEKYGQGKYPDVLTGPDFEQVLSEAGPFGGMVLRPSNGDVPERIAFLVCDGSWAAGAAIGESKHRSLAYAVGLARAVLAKLDNAQAIVICPGLGERAGDAAAIVGSQPNIRFVAADVSRVSQDISGNLTVEWSAGGREDFDLVVLCTGFKLSPAVGQWSQKLGLGLEDAVFWPDDGKRAYDSGREGVLLAGMEITPSP